MVAIVMVVFVQAGIGEVQAARCFLPIHAQMQMNSRDLHRKECDAESQQGRQATGA